MLDFSAQDLNDLLGTQFAPNETPDVLWCFAAISQPVYMEDVEYTRLTSSSSDNDNESEYETYTRLTSSSSDKEDSESEYETYTRLTSSSSDKEDSESEYETYTRLTSSSSDKEDIELGCDYIGAYNALERNNGLLNVASAVCNNVSTCDVHLLYDWKYISTLNLTPRDYEAYSAYLDWDIVSAHIEPETALQYFKARVCWDTIAACNQLDVERFIAAGAVFSTRALVETQTLDDQFIRAIVRAADPAETGSLMGSISKHQKLSEQFLDDFLDTLDHFSVAGFQDISFDFILRNKSRLCKEDVLFFHEFTDDQYRLLGW